MKLIVSVVTPFRRWLNRPLDNDRLLVKTGFARLFRAMRVWQPWYQPQPSEWGLQLLGWHSEKIRAVMSGELFALLRNNTGPLPKLKARSKIHVFFAADNALEVRVDTRRRARAVLTHDYEERTDFTVLADVTHHGLVSSPAVLEHILARVSSP